MEPITFYYNPMSRGRIVHWMLEEVGAKYEIKPLSLEKLEHKSPEYLAVNPMGKVPAIVHEGTVITETPAICAYLADRFPEANLAPRLTEAARGSYYRWMFFTSSCLEQAIVDHLSGRPPFERPGASAYGSYKQVLDTLEGALLPHRYLLGNQFTAVDVYLSSCLAWGFMTKALPMRPVFESYVARCSDRPAFARYTAQAMKLYEQLKATA